MSKKKHNIQTEWEKIKDYNIFDSFDDFEKIFNQNPNGQCFRKYTAYPWCKDNFFFGTNEELHNYYKTTKDIPFYLNEKIGNKYSSLTVKSFFRNEKNDIMANCVCDCGREVSGKWRYITENKIRTCGCRKGNGIQKQPKLNIKQLFPSAIEKFWDFDKNTVNPEEVYIDSKEEFWWKGYNGSFSMPVSCLNTKTGGTSFPEQAIIFYLKKLGLNVLNRFKIKENGSSAEIDIFLPDLKVGIEYDGVHWHKDKYDKDLAKNKYISNINIYLIRIREFGLIPTNIEKGVEIINDIENYDEFTSLALAISELIEILHSKFNVKFIEITHDNIRIDRPKILQTYLLGFEEDNICSTWLINFWSKSNEIEPYLISLKSDERFLFKCKNGTAFVSPKQIMTIYDKLNQEDKIYFKNHLSLKDKCPFIGTSACPANVYYRIDSECFECEYVTGFHKSYKDLKHMFENDFQQPMNLQKFIFYMCEFSLYKPCYVSDLLNDYLVKSVDSNKDKFFNMYKTFQYPNVNYLHIFKFFTHKNVIKYYVENYDFNEIIKVNDIFLNLSHSQNIFNIISGLLFSKSFDILEEFLKLIDKCLSKEQFDNFVLSIFYQLYLKPNTRNNEFINNKNLFNQAIKYLTKYTTNETYNKILDILKLERETFSYNYYKNYILRLKKENKITDDVLCILLTRMGNDKKNYNRLLRECKIEKNRKVSNFESIRIDFLNQTNYSNTPKNINSSNHKSNQYKS